ncbi:MAG: homocysteine S-methyltransferase family protein [Actinomycetota bacterium]
MTRARKGEPIRIDGATGSECLRRGVTMLDDGWAGGAVLEAPDLVRAVHADYIALGADLIASNTFATGRNVLRDTGHADEFERVNRRAVELAIEARADAGADDVVVAGGVSNWSFSGNRPSLEDLSEGTVRQAEIMRDAGVDLISLEMMVDLPRMTATLDAVSTVGLPIWVGLTIGPEAGVHPIELDDPIQLREGGTLREATELSATYPLVDAMCLMHSDVTVTAAGLAAIAEVWDGPLGAYAHASHYVDGEVCFDDGATPAEFAAFHDDWVAAGATMLGGCCGIGPAHVGALYEVMG